MTETLPLPRGGPNTLLIPRFATYSFVPSRLGYSPCVPTPVFDEADLDELVTIDEEHAIRLHVGHKENLAVGRDTDVLGHAAFGKCDIAIDLH